MAEAHENRIHTAGAVCQRNAVIILRRETTDEGRKKGQRFYVPLKETDDLSSMAHNIADQGLQDLQPDSQPRTLEACVTRNKNLFLFIGIFEHIYSKSSKMFFFVYRPSGEFCS